MRLPDETLIALPRDAHPDRAKIGRNQNGAPTGRDDSGKSFYMGVKRCTRFRAGRKLANGIHRHKFKRP
jgi:hypothetical protein